MKNEKDPPYWQGPLSVAVATDALAPPVDDARVEMILDDVGVEFPRHLLRHELGADDAAIAVALALVAHAAERFTEIDERDRTHSHNGLPSSCWVVGWSAPILAQYSYIVNRTALYMSKTVFDITELVNT